MRHAGALFLTTLCGLALCPSVLAQPAGSGAVEVEQALNTLRPPRRPELRTLRLKICDVRLQI